MKGMKSKGPQAQSGKAKGSMYRASGQSQKSGGGQSMKDGYKSHKIPAK